LQAAQVINDDAKTTCKLDLAAAMTG